MQRQKEENLLEAAASPHHPSAAAGVHHAPPLAPLALVPLVLAFAEALLFGILVEIYKLN